MNKVRLRLSLLLLVVVCVMCFSHRADTNASAGSVTDYQKITWGISTGRYYVNGIHAFCSQYNKSWPTVGTVVEQIVPCTNDVLRKALYYGYNGPQNTLGTDARAHVLTAIAVSDANIGESATGASSKYDAFYWELVNNSANYPSPPSNFKVYMAITASDAMQNLAFYEVEKNGYVNGIKTSSDSQLNNGNPCYSFEGAQYGIYTQESLTESSKVGTLTMDASGNSNTVELAPGTYYARENVAPRGYAKSEQVTSFHVASQQTTTLQFADVPQTNPIDILIQKVDADTNLGIPQGRASLGGAEFMVCYYAGLWQNDENPADLGVSPTRTWFFRTDEQGIVKNKEEFLISGDELYETIPLGTIVVRETKASEGYLINNTVFVRQITAEGTSEYVSTYQYPIITEKAVEVRVRKYQSDTEIAIPGTVFEHTAPDGSIEELVTDESGEFVIKGLQYGVHTLREKSVMEGYTKNKSIYTFTVDKHTDGHMEMVIYNDPAPYSVMIIKEDLQKNKLCGAVFALYEDAECKREVNRGLTDESGLLRLSNLEIGKKYYLKELDAPSGYNRILDENGEVHVYEIYAESIPAEDTFICYIDGKEYKNFSDSKALREVYINVINELIHISPKLESRISPNESKTIISPKTGDDGINVLYLVFGLISVIIIAIISCHNGFICDRMTGKYSKTRRIS